MRSPEYLKQHKAVRKHRGKASEQSCVDCGGVALDWSHIHGTDPADVTNYEPRCRRCHVKYDGIGLRPGMTRKGDRLSEEVKAKMSASRTGVKRGPYRITRKKES